MTTQNLYGYVHDAPITISRKRRTPEGFLDVWGVAAKVGRYDYPEHRRVVWVPPAVLADTSTLRDSVLVAEHPATPDGGVDAQTARQHMQGWVAEALFDSASGQQIVRLRVVDADTIRRIESGELTELSPGYDVGLVPVSDAYPEAKAAGCTHVQTFRRVNHLALTKRGRGGPAVRLFLDSAMTLQLTNDAPMVPMQPMQAPMPQMPMMPPMMPPQAPAPMQAPAMDMATWQKEYDALMAKKPQAAAAAAPQPAAPAAPAPAPAAPPAPEPKKENPPMATDAVVSAVQVALAQGVDLAGCTSVEQMQRKVVGKLVGDSMAAALPAESLGALVATMAAPQAAAAAPAPAPQAAAPQPAPMNTAMSLAVKPGQKTADSDPLKALFAGGDPMANPAMAYGK